MRLNIRDYSMSSESNKQQLKKTSMPSATLMMIDTVPTSFYTKFTSFSSQLCNEVADFPVLYIREA